MDTVRIGIVGTSWWAERMYVPAIKSHPRATLVACCGRDAGRTQAFAEKHDVPQSFLDHRAMIATANLDAIVIATPENSHHDICLAAAEAGLHIVCEKPMAMNLAEGTAMQSAVENAGVKNLVYYTWRWLPWMRYTKRLVDEGYVGEIRESRFSFTGGFGRSPEPHWKWDRRSGLGVLGDLGSHMIDMAHWLVGPIVDVDASVKSFVDRSWSSDAPFESSNDSAMLNVTYRNGSHGVIEASAVAALGDRGMALEVHIHGEKGTLQASFDFLNGWRLWGVRDDESGGPLEIPASLMDGVDEQAGAFEQFAQVFTTQPVGMRSFIDAIVEDENIEPSLEDGLRVQRVLETALDSDRERRRLPVD